MPTTTPALGSETHESIFGQLPDGRPVKAVTLSNQRGISATVIAWGAGLQAVVMPDRSGQRADVQLGYAKLNDYLSKSDYFGATVGRCANRIANGRFTLDGHQYSTPINDGPNSLHGGTTGLDKVLWEVVATKSGATAEVTLRYVSPDGDQGYPGTLTVTATYSLSDDNQLSIVYLATTDRPTIVNLSNHSYWNLAGEGAAQGAMGHLVMIPAESYTPVDRTLIPTGELRSVAGSAFDFRTPRVISDRLRDGSEPQLVYGRGYDHNFVLSRAVTAEPYLMARVSEPVSGRSFELWSNQPGLQFYSGNFLDGTGVGKSQRSYRQGDAIALEPQLFPDTPNQPHFGSARLAPGQTYRNVIVYRLATGQHTEATFAKATSE
jgi:aldose 1-epimerase